MNKELPNRVFPTMVTPFSRHYTIDYKALKPLVRWYEREGIDGLFAVCQSSAMFELSREERRELCTAVVGLSRGQYPVIASGHVSDTLEDQVRDLVAMAEAGADALVLVTNRLAPSGESNTVWRRNLELLMKRLPDHLPLGFYECPQPYKRLLSIEEIRWMAESGRFAFVKDTCCDPQLITARAAAVKGTGLKLYNANAPTLLHSLRAGYAGYSGIMTNFHGRLYHWMCRNWQTEPERAEELQAYLGTASVIEYQSYPLNAKYSLLKDEVIGSTLCRRGDARGKRLTPAQMLEIEQFRSLSQRISAAYQ